jgi:hypothetical protein
MWRNEGMLDEDLMVTLNIKTNFSNVQRQLDAMRKDIATKALASALNKTTEQAKTEMSKEIRAEFVVTAAYVRERLRVKRATFDQGRYAMSAALIGGDGKRRSANIIRFVEKVVTLAQARKRAKEGTLKQLHVKVRRGEGLKRLGPAFIGNKGRTVFSRTGASRLPIKPVRTIDVAQMFNAKRINLKVRGYMLRKFPEVFNKEAAFYTRRFNGG